MQLLIDARLLAQGGKTGVEIYAHNIIGRLIATRPETPITLFYNAWRTAPLPEEWHAPHVRVVNWGVPNKLYDLWQPAIDRYIPCDAIYSPHINRLHFQHTPRALTIHDLSFIHYPQFFPLKYRLWHSRQRIALQAREAAVIITNSQYTKRDIMDTLGVPEGKIRVIYPGVDAPAAPVEAPASLSSAQKAILAKPYILSLSTLEPRKNILGAISAFSLLRRDPRFADLNLIVAGGKSWKFDPPRHPGVIYWGGMNQEEKAFMYTEAEALIFPSFFEGFGFPPLEAQSYGCPVIASDRASLPEILGDSALLMSPWNVHGLAGALETLLTDHGERDRLIARGRENAARFDWNTTICELSNIFSSLSSR